ncbi:hypothetical protein MTO96_047011 [Rhipicephalus appendiculatus]
MNLQVQGNPIPRTDHIRILGLHLQANGSNTISLQCIDQSVVKIGRLLKRVSNNHRGMRESNLLRLVQAFICSRITYSAPYLRLTRAESEHLETTLRKAYKTALGLPMPTATHKLMTLGITNTVSELMEATLTAKYERLSLTRWPSDTAASWNLTNEGGPQLSRPHTRISSKSLHPSHSQADASGTPR